ncbi:MAG: 50S ribosomal protein L9 [Lentimicrobiaceae bacterium]|nr:50S ribosomal protein L9 [Lentimicrobiaceae bacterium]
MEIILKQDVNGLGYANDIVVVKDGYANNYLIPKGLAVMATETNKKIAAETQRQRAFKEQKTRQEAELVAESLKDVMLKIGAKAAESGKIYGSVNNIQIAEAIKEQYKIEIDRKKIVLDGEAIKELGKYTATAKIYKDISVEIPFEVVAE